MSELNKTNCLLNEFCTIAGNVDFFSELDCYSSTRFYYEILGVSTLPDYF